MYMSINHLSESLAPCGKLEAARTILSVEAKVTETRHVSDDWVTQTRTQLGLHTALGRVGNLNGLGLRVYPLEELKDKINFMLDYREIKLYLIATLC